MRVQGCELHVKSQELMCALCSVGAATLLAAVLVPIDAQMRYALTQAERQEILRVANEPRFADMPPARIVPMLAAGVPLYCQRVKLCPGAACAWTKPPPRADDNAFVESLFKTVKYRPEFPVQGMQSLAHARQWAAEFAHWYNHVHRHSGIQYVTPHQRHTGQDIEILRKRRQVYEEARQTRLPAGAAIPAIGITLTMWP